MPQHKVNIIYALYIIILFMRVCVNRREYIIILRRKERRQKKVLERAKDFVSCGVYVSER